MCLTPVLSSAHKTTPSKGERSRLPQLLLSLLRRLSGLRAVSRASRRLGRGRRWHSRGLQPMGDWDGNWAPSSAWEGWRSEAGGVAQASGVGVPEVADEIQRGLGVPVH